MDIATATIAATDIETRAQVDTLIAGRYRLEHVLGRGGFAVTWLAVDQTTSARVAVKILSLRSVDHWKAVELFEREARVLRNLEHPQIPRYLDFIAPSEGSDRFVLVQELAEGDSLADLVKRGWRPTEAEARDLADQILGILDYLHSRSPPVVHRDLKPANIVRRADGRVAIVDFGSVRDRLAGSSEHASTAGTFGYMAPEQITGRATPASDLYGLGATLVNVLSHHAPDELPQNELRLDFREVIHVSPGFERFLSRLLAPAPEKRFASAQAARRALATGMAAPGSDKHRLGNFAAERVAVVVTPDALVVDIAPQPRWPSVLFTLLALAATVALVTSGVSGELSWFRLFWAVVTGLITWRLGLRAGRSLTNVGLRMDADGTTVERRLGGMKIRRRHISRGEPATLAKKGLLRRDLLLHTRGRTERLGAGLHRDTVAAVEARVLQLAADLGE
ncbi:MAG: serine/threonine protein kinase [Deltaproteobacteria bacterium]|nr:serine/threonine protein kinase [Deltaproteobacteria bacterium]